MTDQIERYKSFIDALVSLSSSVYARRMRQGQWPSTGEDAAMSRLVSRLPSEDRELLATALEEARTGGMHDMLAYFQEQMDRKKLAVHIEGSELPNSPFGTELFYDFVCRLKGDEWPKS